MLIVKQYIQNGLIIPCKKAEDNFPNEKSSQRN